MKIRIGAKGILWLSLLLPSFVTALSCGGGGTNGCNVSATVIPANATADHSLLAPGNQVQFSTTFTASGSCVLSDIVTAGSWSSSDSVNISISNQSPTQGLATCLNATASPATISYSGIQSGYGFTPAILSCK
jgi:hypothetical protein